MRAILLTGFLFLANHCLSQTPVKLFSFPSQPTWSPGNTVSKISSFQTGLVYVQGTELLYSDGTQAGTKVLRDFGAEANSITNFYELASTLYFTSQYGTSLVLWQTDGTDAGTTPLDTLSNGTSSTYINGFTSLGSTLYFTASANEQGAELWKYNGTECELVADINPGTPSGVNGIPVAFNNKLYFSGSNTTHGYELWQSDGTTAGTILLKDIHTTASSSPGNFTVFNTKLYFSANGASGIELYSTDGTAAGTVLLKDISAGTPSSSPRSFVIYNSALHFAAYDGTDFAIWKTTGTSAGTTKVVQLAARASGYSTSEFKLCNGSLYFLLSWNYSYSCGFNRTCNSNGKSFKQLAGSTLNTVSGSYPGSFDLSKSVVLNNKLYYVENASSCWYSSCTYYDYLMEFSGTTGTVLLSFSRSQYNGTNAINTKPVVAGGTLFFGASNTVSGGELWTLNTAVSEATVAFERFTGDMVTSVPNTGELKKLGTKLFTLAARQPGINPHQLWQYDMLAKTSVLVFDIGAGNSISNLTLINNKFYFQGNTNQKGSEPYVSDGTTAGTFLLRDILAGHSSSLNWASFSRAGSLVAFTAYDETNGAELWVTNGTTAGTVFLKDVEPGNATASDLSFLGNLPNNVLIFAATTTAAGRELWRSDGTAAGTYLLKDLNAGAPGSDPYFFSNHNGYLYFSAYTATGGRELYRTDGTAAGTILLKDFTAGASDSYLYPGATTGTEIVFGVQETTYGTELWKSNGTAAGTVLVKDVNPGTASGVSSFYNSKVGNYLFFIGNDGVNGNELWTTNGTTAGTQMVKDLTPGATGSGINFLGHNNGLLYFILNVSGAQELWQSDGTEAGTTKIIRLGNTSIQSINHLTFINNLLVVNAYSAQTGYELFWLRGTPDHYRSLSDINPGTGSSNTASILTESNQLYFYANDGTGNSMYSFDNLATLPVSFGFFNGKKDGPRAVLTWKAYETANEQFVIERSANGLSFQQIGTVAAGVFSSRNYQFTDASPRKGTNYYRIKTNEANGQPLYSATVQLHFDDAGSKFSIYPNPASEKATLFFLASQKETVVLTVTDYSGKQAMVKTVPVQEGANMLPLSLQALAPGLYQLQITSAGGNEQVIFVKQ